MTKNEDPKMDRAGTCPQTGNRQRNYRRKVLTTHMGIIIGSWTTAANSHICGVIVEGRGHIIFPHLFGFILNSRETAVIYQTRAAQRLVLWQFQQLPSAIVVNSGKEPNGKQWLGK